jgi:nucleoside phosphorylase
MKFLVVAAFEPELTEFRRLAITVVAQVDTDVAQIGVGLVDAAMGMTRCIARHRPTHAILLGTCGTFAGAPGGVVTGREVRLADASVAAGRAAIPPPMPTTAPLDAALHDALVAAGATSAAIVNTLAITTDDTLAAALAVEGGVEHLEAFAFARACAEAGIAANVALGVANVVGTSGRDQWRANHVAASASAARIACDAIASLATRR